MVTRPFSSVIGMSPTGGFKNRWRKKSWLPLIDNPFNDGFWAKILIFFFQLSEMRDTAKTWWLVSGPDVASSFFFLKKIRVALESQTFISVPLLQAMT